MIAARMLAPATRLMRAMPPSVSAQARLLAERAALARVRRVQLTGAALLRRAVELPPLTDDAVERAWSAARAVIAGFTLPDGTGGMNPGDRRAVYCLAAGLRPSRVLEVGTHIGASTIHLSAAMRDHAPLSGRRLVSVDLRDVNDPATQPWRDYGATHSPRQMVEGLGCDFVEFVPRPSLDFMRETGEQFDLVVLDGDHSARTVYREVPAALRVLAPGGVILLHDYFPDLRPLWPSGAVIHGPWLALRRLRAEGLDVVVQPLGALPWPTKEGSSNTSLAVVARRA